MSLDDDWILFKRFARRTLDAKVSKGSGVLSVYLCRDACLRNVSCRPTAGEVWGTTVVGEQKDTCWLQADDPLAWFDFLRSVSR